MAAAQGALAAHNAIGKLGRTIGWTAEGHFHDSQIASVGLTEKRLGRAIMSRRGSSPSTPCLEPSSRYTPLSCGRL